MDKINNGQINDPQEIMNKISQGIMASKIDVAIKARMYNTKIISWENGKIVEIDPYSIDIDDK